MISHHMMISYHMTILHHMMIFHQMMVLHHMKIMHHEIKKNDVILPQRVCWPVKFHTRECAEVIQPPLVDRLDAAYICKYLDHMS